MHFRFCLDLKHTNNLEQIRKPHIKDVYLVELFEL